MKKIENLSNKIEKEIQDAYEYAKCALELKDSEPELAETYYKIASNRMNDMTLMHEQVVKIIDEYRKEYGDPPAGMQVLYNILHKKHIENAATVKGMLALFNES